MLTRRQTLSLGVRAACGLAAATALRRFPLARAAKPRTALAPPRYHVKLFMPGGVDAIFTMDPKEVREVAPGVDVPYPAKEIVTAGRIRLGPHFASLAKWAPRFAIVKGVDVSTANHNTGQSQAMRLRTKTTGAMPTIFEILGAHRDGQPLGAISLGGMRSECHSPGWFGEPGPLYGPPENTLLKHIDGATPEDLRTLARVLRKQSQRLASRNGGSEILTSAQNLGESAAFFERVADTPKFVVEPWGAKDAQGEEISARLQRALWLLEHDLTATVFLQVVGGSVDWDTHTDSTRRQTLLTGKFMPLLDRFLAELDQRAGKHGKLADTTAIILASELGRLPYLNAALGKDHYPEAPFLFMGPWFAGGETFGRTGKQLEGSPIELATGKPATAGGHHVMLDDVGSTLLALSGVDPELYGYNGKPLEFLVR